MPEESSKPIVCMGAILARHFIFDERIGQWRIIEPIAMVEVERDPGGRPALVDLGTLSAVVTFAGGRPGDRLRLASRLVAPEGIECNGDLHEQEVVLGENPLGTYHMQYTDVEISLKTSGMISWEFTCNGEPLANVGLYVVYKDEANSQPLVCTGAMPVVAVERDAGGRDHLIAPIGPYEVERRGHSDVWSVHLRDSHAVLVVAGGRPGDEVVIAGSVRIPNSATVSEKSTLRTLRIRPTGPWFLCINKLDLQASVTAEGEFTLGFLANGEPLRQVTIPYFQV